MSAHKHHGRTKKEVKAIRTALADAQEWLCYWCKVRMTPTPHAKPTMVTLEHIIAMADGGANDETNMVAACVQCNSTRVSEANLRHNKEQGRKVA